QRSSPAATTAAFPTACTCPTSCTTAPSRGQKWWCSCMARNVMLRRCASFSSFGKWHHCIILVPLFPIGVCGDDYRDGYKDMAEKDIRYDQVLLHMVEEAA